MLVKRFLKNERMNFSKNGNEQEQTALHPCPVRVPFIFSEGYIIGYA